MYLELLARIVLSSSICQVVLHLLFSIGFLPKGDVTHSALLVSFSSTPDATACRSAICSSFPSSMGTSSAPRSTRALFLSSTRSDSATLCMHSSLPFPSKFSQLIVLILSLGSLLCDWIACDAGGAQPGHFSSVTVSLDVLGIGGPTPLTFFVNFNVVATICHGVPHKPLQFVTSHGSLSACLVQL